MLRSQAIGVILIALIVMVYSTMTTKREIVVQKEYKTYSWLDSVDVTHYEDYIKTYARYAIIEQEKHGIPASITLAQGLLESGSGQSKLAVIGNNHFGIKCFSKNCQKGHCMNYEDDSHKDFFRVYKSAYDSYLDHSQFLKKPRYRHLLELSYYDYKGWAHGLKRAGYATDKRYPDKLIQIIEKYDLNEIQ